MSTATLAGLGRSDFHAEGPKALDNNGQRQSWILLGVLVAILVLAFSDSLWRTWVMWWKPQYQFGFIIPIIAAFLLHHHREPFVAFPAWQRWVGVALIVGGMMVRYLSAQFTIFYFDNLAFLPCLMGAFVIVGGLPTVRWAGPAILFLIFMYPFPYKVEKSVMGRLQDWSTRFSTIAMVTLGIDAVQDGTQIYIPGREAPMNVAEQCSGLRMSTILTGMGVAFALFATSRPWWERMIVVVSGIPIAMIVNVTRITITGLLYTAFSAMNWDSDLLDTMSHDVAGGVMILMAFGLLLLEFQILKHLVVDVPDEVRPVQMVR